MRAPVQFIIRNEVNPLPGVDARRWRGTIALDAHTFIPACLGFSNAKFELMLDRFDALGLTHVIVMLRCRYRGLTDFDLRGPEHHAFVRQRLEYLKARGKAVVLWGAGGEWYGDDYAGILRDWVRLLPPLADLIDIAIPGPEFNDFLTPRGQHETILAMELLLPDALRLVHFTRSRSHGAHVIAGHPSGPIPSEWHPYVDDHGIETASFEGFWNWAKDHCHGLAYNVDYPHLTNEATFRQDIGDISERITGMDIPWVGSPNHYAYRLYMAVAELAGEWVLNAGWTYEQQQRLRNIALAVPGVSGVGD